MATELERTLGDALRRYADRIEKGEPYVRNSTIQKWCRDIANDMREDAAAYDTAQSQPGDTPEARSGDSGAVAWRYYPPKDPTCYIVKRHRITNMTECGLDGCVEEPLYTHPSDSAWRKAFAAWTDEILPRGISNRIDPETATDWIERRARELDAARDRGGVQLTDEQTWPECLSPNATHNLRGNRMFQKYRRTQIAEMRQYMQGETLSDRVSISASDREAGSPKLGDMIARNPKNHDDQWLVAAQYFTDNFEPMP